MQLLVAIVVAVFAVYAGASLAALAQWLRNATRDELLEAMSPAGRARVLRLLLRRG